MNNVLLSTSQDTAEHSPLTFRPPALAPIAGPAELSFAQQRLWFLEQMHPGQTTYAIPLAIELRGRLDARALERAWALLIARHESLRTVFTTKEGRPMQAVTAFGTWRLPVTDLSGDRQPHEGFEELLQAEIRRGFDLARGPLFRARLYRLGAGLHVLLLTMHHIVSDGWSMGILFRELGELYGRLVRGEPASPASASLQYRDFAQWQRQWLQGERLKRLLSYWRARLAGAPQALELPTDRPRPPTESNRGARYAFTLPGELAEALRRLALREKATIFMPLLAGFTALLSRYSGQEDLLVGTPVANRTRAEFEGVVGCFVNTLVLRADLSGDPSAGAYLHRIRQTCLEGLQHQDLPFERLVEELQPQRDLSRSPLVQVMFSLENMPLGPLHLEGATQQVINLERGVTHVDLTLRVREVSNGLQACFEYATDLFDPPMIQRMAAHWRSLLQGMAACPDQPLSQLPLISEPERCELLVTANHTAADYPREARVQDLVEWQARRTPEAVAVSFGSQKFTYGELNQRSAQIAQVLRHLGIGPGLRVGLCLERSPEMVMALLGVLKTGAAYVPLDPSFPPERLRFIADDAQLGLLLSTAALADHLELPRTRRLLLDEDAQQVASALDGNVTGPAGTASAADPAYIIYTSGSTGRPKGVIVPHRAVVNFLVSMAREPGLTAADTLLAVTTLSFDIAVLELLLPLTVGAEVVIATADEAREGQALASLLQRHCATLMQATPGTWRLLLETGWKPAPRFRALIGGEALPKSLADQLLARGVDVWNMYGPTETTVWSTCAHITDTTKGITIGKPIANTTVWILDAHRQLCPIGVPGELCIGGEGVSLGYWRLPELTTARFILDPVGAAPGARLYRTGDRARWRGDGMLEHLGRLDHQIKLRGFRIEPGEVETVIALHPSVREVVVVAREDTPGDQRLVAYLVATDPPADLTDQLRARLHVALPEYMVPTQFVLLPALPRTPNGKLDRNELPRPELEAEPPRSVTLEPQTPTERMVVEAFRGVLGRADIGVHDSFFSLGGHSLMAARLMVRLRTAAGVDLPMRLLFERPTPAELAEALDSLLMLSKSNAPTSSADAREEIEV